MSATLAELEEQARRLSPEERAYLAAALLESLQETPLADIEAAWEREIDERVAAFDRGEQAAISAEEVFAEARHLTR
jgi:putative addiction module component (TIGR02574 family)